MKTALFLFQIIKKYLYKLLANLLLLLLLQSCGVFNPLKVDEIERLKLEVPENTNINYNFTFEARIIAILKSGEQIDITNHRNTTFQATDISKNDKRNIFFVNQPYMENFEKDSLRYTIMYEKGRKRIESNGSLALNFGGGYQLIDNSFRNSVQASKNAKYQVMIWKEDSYYHLYFLNRKWKYKTKGEYPFIFNLNGSKGFKGKNGDGGKDGSDGHERWLLKQLGPVEPTDGETGGDGEQGGQGGTGGHLELIIHPNAKEVLDNLIITVEGGEGGEGGEAGLGGDGGNPLEGQTAGRPGANGREGMKGEKGLDGISNVQVLEFDPANYY